MTIKKSTAVLLLLLLSLFSMPGFAGGMKEATWYVVVDVDQVENNKIYQLLLDQKQQYSDRNPFELANIPKEISHITLYGDAKGSEDATALIKGDFSQFSLNEHLLRLIYADEKNSKMVKDSVMNYKQFQINVIEVNKSNNDKGNDEDIKEIFSSKINNQLTVISFDVNEVKNWLDKVYSEKSMKDDSLFSVVVDVESALAHMGVNLQDHNMKMHSEIFKKVTQVSASLSEVNDDIEVVVALTTSDDATAVQIEQVLNGLIAMNNLSGANNDNELHAAFMQNLTIDRNANSILVSTFASFENMQQSVLTHSPE